MNTIVKIKFTTTQAFEAWQWCKDNSIPTSGIQKTVRYHFEFECEEDAMAFKLRWV